MYFGKRHSINYTFNKGCLVHVGLLGVNIFFLSLTNYTLRTPNIHTCANAGRRMPDALFEFVKLEKMELPEEKTNDNKN